MKRREQSRQSRQDQAGFTLMEILIVLIIIMILAGYVGINILNKPGEARVAAANMQIKTLKQAVKLYHAEQRRFPTLEQGLEALCVKPTLPPVPEHYPADGYIDSRSVPEDPWGNAYIYLIPGRQNESFEIISYGADGEEGGEGDDADISSSD